MSSPVDKIKERLNILEVVGTYIKLDRAGMNWKGKCPFHNEKTPSFFVSPERSYYYCFGCGAKGDIFSFVQNFEGLDFRGALKVLADKAGVELTPERPGVRDEKERLLAVMEAATNFFVGKLTQNSPAHDYLTKRGLSEATIKEWRIGFVPDAWRDLSDHLRRLGYTDQEMEKAGLFKRTDSAAYDRFRGRIIFPLFDSAGRVIAFSGRILVNNDDAAKYLNSPETPLFNKSEILYGFDKAKVNIRKFDYSILVEGQMDLLQSHQAGFNNTVASSGTALTVSHLKLLKRISNRVIMAFDSDSAGLKAATRAWKLGLALGMEVKIAQIPEGFDPADLILKGLDGTGKNGKEDWKEVLKNSKHIIDFLLSKVLIEKEKNKTDDRRIALNIREQIFPYLILVESSVEQSHYVKKIADATGLKEEAIWDDLRKMPVPKLEEISATDGDVKVAENKKQTDSILRQDTLERRLAGLLLWQDKKPQKDIEVEPKKNELIAIIGPERWNIYSEASPIDLSDIIFQAEIYYNEHQHLDREANILLAELKEEILKKSLEAVMKEMTQAQKEGQGDKAFEILKKINDLSKQLDELKNKKKTL
ncbi:MAG: DNA primase [Minisyncoccia bacterium]